MKIDIDQKELQHLISGLGLMKTDLTERRNKFFSNKNACQLLLDISNNVQLLKDKLLKFVVIENLD